MRIDQVAQMDPLLAGILHQMKPKEISPVMVLKEGYAIVKLEKKEPLKLEDVYREIEMLLIQQKREEAYRRWIEEKKRLIVVQKYAS